MSSVSLSTRRKRLRSPDFSDGDISDIELERSPLRKRKKQKRSVAIPIALKERLHNLAVWINELPLKSFFMMALKAGTRVPEEIVIDDDDDDNVDDDDVQPLGFDHEKLLPMIQRLKCQESKGEKKIFDQNGSMLLGSCYDSQRMNGSSSLDWKSPYDRDSAEQWTGSLRPVVSNPPIDVEVFLDTDVEKQSDDIEILSESRNTKPKQATSRKSFPASRLSLNRSSIPQSLSHSQSSSSAKNGQPSSSRNFTANEVVRLQEKAQYKMLIEKYMTTPQYRHCHVARKQPKKVIDVEVEDDQLDPIQYDKQVLSQPIDDFFEKYCKPCQLMTPAEKKANEKAEKKAVEKEPAEEIKIDDDDEEDDELQILEVKLPKCKARYHSRKYLSPAWIEDLKRSVHAQTEERLRIVQQHEEQLEEHRKNRVLNKLKLILPQSDPEFPELTPEMEKEVDDAVKVGDPEEVLVKTSVDPLLRKDFETLHSLNWLNDTIVNTYLDLIVARSKQEGYPSVYAFNTFFYPTYKSKGYSSVRRWTRKIDIFSYDLLFVPIHAMNLHWCLCVIDNRSKKICYYDSMGSGEEICLDLLHHYVMCEYKDKKGIALDNSTYTTEIIKDIPQQMNGSDCGMFTLKYAEYVSRDAEITFNQSNMAYFRRRTIYELLHLQLITN